MPYKIVFESYYDNHWGLKMAHADGLHPTILTKTPHTNSIRMYAPNGRKICFLVDEGEGPAKSRNVYYRNMDGTGRQLVVKNGRDPCWNADGTAISCTLRAKSSAFTYMDYASKGIFPLQFGHPATSPSIPMRSFSHLYCFCCLARRQRAGVRRSTRAWASAMPSC